MEKFSCVWKFDYTFTALLPKPVDVKGTSYEILALGEHEPFLYDVDSGLWNDPESPRPAAGPVPFLGNPAVAGLLLPIRLEDGRWGYQNGSFLAVGGHYDMPTNRSADVYDPAANEWVKTVDVTIDQHHSSAVALPDGTIAVVGARPALLKVVVVAAGVEPIDLAEAIIVVCAPRLIAGQPQLVAPRPCLGNCDIWTGHRAGIVADIEARLEADYHDLREGSEHAFAQHGAVSGIQLGGARTKDGSPWRT